ncbi:coiled-coil domain-containing protein 152-like [Polypterus senegalus]|uniref:coiled-coil domain-containing protein 152-like n=1 Tax=Polypterus senegalus TaxID=55291 RepID=UPI001966BEB1|nr:coiled-coil domain-containing protein 152-like [Polypterus senegalus]
MKKANSIHLDKLIEDFNMLEKKALELEGKNNLLDIKLEETSNLLKFGQNKELSLKNECASLQATVKVLQDIIQSQLDFRDENEQLRKQIQNFEMQKRSSEQEYRNKEEQLQINLMVILKDHETKLEEVQNDMKEKFSKCYSVSYFGLSMFNQITPQMKSKLQFLQEEKNKEIEILCQKIKELEDQHCSSNNHYQKRKMFK